MSRTRTQEQSIHVNSLYLHAHEAHPTRHADRWPKLQCTRVQCLNHERRTRLDRGKQRLESICKLCKHDETHQTHQTSLRSKIKHQRCHAGGCLWGGFRVPRCRSAALACTLTFAKISACTESTKSLSSLAPVLMHHHQYLPCCFSWFWINKDRIRICLHKNGSCWVLFMPGLWCTQRMWYSRLLSQVSRETWLWVTGGWDITRNQNTKIHDACCVNTPFKGIQVVSITVIVCLAVYLRSSGMEKQLSWCDFLEIWNQVRLDRTLVAQRRPGDSKIVMQS